ncbi:MAG: 50S ribosomal protein L21 [Gammaproteobacteria bacterium]|jgi:large subunit ribosomal protein L21|nr:50S ribosomal protein L21 [Gammaproteobacteria bacterium]MBI5615350.1 50S ribosomal protein L21 [Gammaproteobacteria bacterium]
MHAIIKTGGKQYRVTAGEKLRVETLPGNPGDVIEFSEVLLISAPEGTEVGRPLLAGAKVTATVLEHGRGDKIRIVKFKRRKHHRKQMGHRQNFTKVEINQIVKG